MVQRGNFCPHGGKCGDWASLFCVENAEQSGRFEYFFVR